MLIGSVDNNSASRKKNRILLIIFLALVICVGLVSLFFIREKAVLIKPDKYTIDENLLNSILLPIIYPQYSKIDTKMVSVAPTAGISYKASMDQPVFAAYSYPVDDRLILEVYFLPEYLEKVNDVPEDIVEVSKFFNEQLAQYLVKNALNKKCEDIENCPELVQQYIGILP